MTKLGFGNFWQHSPKEASKHEEQKKIVCPPTTEQLEGEVKRVRYKSRYRSVLRSTIYSLITVAAIAVLIATLWLPVLQVYGNSMTPTL